MNDTLLKNCICGSQNSDLDVIHSIPVLTCKNCGVKRQDLPGYTEAMYFDYYKNDYHSAEQVKIGCTAYKDRYKHDFKIAAMRLDEYKKILSINSGQALDIGSSNNAFVDYMNQSGFNCLGIEIGEEGHNHPDTTYTNDILELGLAEDSFDIITLHDVFEHLIYPEAYLKEIKRILKPGGFMILDLPNYFVQEGVHHWRPVQHLWFFTRGQTVDILENNGFSIIDVKEPIASKLVFYCQVK